MKHLVHEIVFSLFVGAQNPEYLSKLLQAGCDCLSSLQSIQQQIELHSYRLVLFQ